jgi:hypothetical protein
MSNGMVIVVRTSMFPNLCKYSLTYRNQFEIISRKLSLVSCCNYRAMVCVCARACVDLLRKTSEEDKCQFLYM